MLEGHDIVCFANDWQSDPTSKKHIMGRLAERNRVLWVNSIGCRTPQVSARDLRRVFAKGRDFLRGLSQVGPNLWTLSPIAVPFHGVRAAQKVNRWLLAAGLKLACRRLGMRDVITWTFVPSSAPVAGRLGENLLVYHCVDEFAQFTGVDGDAMLALEADLATRADLVLVTAARLYDAKVGHNPNTYLVRHGVDVDHFRRALAPDLAIADELQDAPHPVLGFFGLIADWVDVDVMAHIARARPEWTLALVGAVETDVSALQALPNVRLIGRRPYAELPRYCKAFDAALLPFRINELTLAANPLKLREYLAAGLPVVSSALPEVEALAELVQIARTPEEWLRHLDAIVDHAGAGPQAARADSMRGESWDGKVEEMSTLVEAYLAAGTRRGGRQAGPARTDRRARARPCRPRRPVTARGTLAVNRGHRRFLLCAALSLATARGEAIAAAAPDQLSWWTTDALHKVRPDDAPAAPRPVELFAARNEFEPFQLVLRAEQPLSGVDVELVSLAPVAAAKPASAAPGATIYLERYVNLRLPSSLEGAAGEWPDPLLPRVDTYAGERRAAFPFALAARRNQPLWIEIYVPPETPAGDYRGALRVSVRGAARIEVPFSLRVWPFTLPSTSTLRTTFGFSAISAAKQHRGAYEGDEDLYRWTDLYSRAALRHRLSLHGGSMVPPPASFAGDAATVDWRAYDREVGPFLDGALDRAASGGFLPGARFTAIDLRTPTGLSEARKIAYWRAWARHFRERGWNDRLFYYVMDEPQPQDYPHVLAEARLAHEADRGIATLLTEQWVPALAGAIDVWVPLINLLDAKDDGSEPDAVARAAYAPALGQGAHLWWYQSCSSHGCDTVGGKEFAGWPSYVIDTPAVGNRIMPWLAFVERIEGELYYNTVESYTRNADAWNDPATHGGNGDGTLFYPGTPAKVGGRTDLPIESLRLKLIREGLEDYEYLTLLAGAGRETEARSWAAALAPRASQWEHDPEKLYALRRRIGEALAARAAGISGGTVPAHGTASTPLGVGPGVASGEAAACR